MAHFDLDSFFVSVELLNNPSLKGRPVYVGGHDRGVVSAASYEARKYGIHSGMPSSEARLLCPQAIALHGTRGEYSRYSRWVTQIIAAKAPLFEKASIDEFYLDLTGMDRFFNPLEWTISLRQQIMEETGLPISFGFSSNKMMARIATNEAKPNGYLQIPFGMEKEFLAPLSVDKIPGVGEHTHAVLQYMGINTIGDISKHPVEERLGKWGGDLWQKSQGIHIRYPDFETISQQTTLHYTCADDEIMPVVRQLFDQLWQKAQPIRLQGVRLSDLPEEGVQTDLF